MTAIRTAVLETPEQQDLRAAVAAFGRKHREGGDQDALWPRPEPSATWA